MKSQYLTPLWLEDIDGVNWILAAEFRYYSELLRGIIRVPIRTETDLASIPMPTRMILPRSGKYNKASVLHDTGYKGLLLSESGARINLVKHLCDDVFLEAMLLSNVDEKLAHSMYRLVSIFGRKELVHEFKLINLSTQLSS